MTRLSKLCFVCTVVMLAVIANMPKPACGQTPPSEPRIGYVYPAGGQRGETFRVLVAGRQMNRVTEAFCSGSGVRCRIVAQYQNLFVNDADARLVIRRSFIEAVQNLGRDEISSTQDTNDNTNNLSSSGEPLPTLEQLAQRYPYLEHIVSPTAAGLQLVFCEYFDPQRDRRPKESFAQGVLLEVTIDRTAYVGRRDLRLITARGVTAPFPFIVGDMREVCEQEPNDVPSEVLQQDGAWGTRRKLSTLGGGNIAWTWQELPPQTLPVVFSGQIRSSDVDRLTFRARAGDRVTVGVAARRLNPFLADAVPGWFQAAISLIDPGDNRVAEAASSGHNPDPKLTWDARSAGIYTLVVHDSIFRGREDFVYRITVTASPKPDDVVATTNTTVSTASDMRVTLPTTVTGQLRNTAQTDCYRFAGKRGDVVVFDLRARRDGSPLDARIDLLDANGNVIASNDDRADSSGPNIGLDTHHADPYIITALPSDGEYTASVAGISADGAANGAWGYSLRMTPPQEDVELYTTASSLSFLNERTQPLTIRAIRRDGFSGEITLRVAEPDAADFTVVASDANIPIGSDTATIKVTLTGGVRGDAVTNRVHRQSLHLEGMIRVGDATIVRPVIAADDREQAFIYHHLIPADSLVVVGPPLATPSPPRRRQQRE